MGRLILVLLIVVVVVWLVVRGRMLRAARAARTGGARADLVQCAECGVHLPRAEAHLGGERHYCCSEHLMRGRERADE